MKVIFIDDEYYFRNSLRRAIPWEEQGFVIAGDTNNGLTGLKLLRELEPDLALVDINMPQLTGLQLIETAQAEGIGCKFIVLTGYDDFKYAQKAVQLGVSDYVLKPLDHQQLLQSVLRMREVLEKERQQVERLTALEAMNSAALRENFFADLVNCSILLGEESLRRYAKDLGIRLPFRFYRACIFECAQVGARNALRKILTQRREQEPELVEFFMDSRQRLCVLWECAGPQEPVGFVTEATTQMQTQAVPGLIGVGEGKTQLGDLFLSYNEAHAALNQRLVNPGPVLYYKADSVGGVGFRCDTAMKNRLLRSVQDCNLQELDQALDEIFMRFEVLHLSCDQIVLCTLELLSILSDNMREEILQPLNLLENRLSLFETLEAMRSLESLRAWIREIFAKAFELLHNTQSQCGAITQKVIQYIQANYANPKLSIEQISRALYLNYSYLCCCFKRDRGMTINDYITQYRMAQACALFDQSCGNVGIVSERVGYDNAGYFSKCFKKQIGVSPRDYIKQAMA